MSSKTRFQDTGKGSFFGDFVYDQVIPRDHFLVALEQLFDWEGLTEQLIRLYKGQGLVGRAPYPPVLVFKMLFLSYLFGVSERQMEELAQYHLAVKWFLGLALHEPAPDHSTLTKFKARLLQNTGEPMLEGICSQVLQQARAQGLVLGGLQVLDSVHTQADVNLDKDDKRQGKGQPPRAAEAQVVDKGEREVVEPDGTRVKRRQRCKGYKTHVAVNAQTGIVTSLSATPGNRADNKEAPKLIARDQEQALGIAAYGGDKAYDDTDLFARLEALGLRGLFCLRLFRTGKLDANKEPWLALQADPEYQAACAHRYRVEQPFGPAKQKHGFGRCRHLGLARYRIQALLTFLVSNLKRIVKLLTGLTFRPLAKGRHSERFRPVYARLPWA
jgi:IS5 family transposase